MQVDHKVLLGGWILFGKMGAHPVFKGTLYLGIYGIH